MSKFQIWISVITTTIVVCVVVLYLFCYFWTKGRVSHPPKGNSKRREAQAQAKTRLQEEQKRREAQEEQKRREAQAKARLQEERKRRVLLTLDSSFEYDLCTTDMDLDESNFWKKFSGIRPLSETQKSSTSPTLIYHAMYNGKEPVFIKSFVLPFSCHPSIVEKDLDDRFLRLLYEVQVYRYIQSMSKTHDDITRSFIQLVLSNQDKKTNRFFLCTQDVKGIKLEEKVHQSKITDHDRNARFMFQLLYILYLLHKKLGIVHNDLHHKNVIVVDNSSPRQTITFFGKRYTLENHPFSLCVYDFDMATTTLRNKGPLLPNPSHVICEQYGSCRNPQKDLFQWLEYVRSDFILLNEQKKRDFINELYQECPSIQKFIDQKQNNWSLFCLDMSPCIEKLFIPKFDLRLLVRLFWKHFFSHHHSSQQDSQLQPSDNIQQSYQGLMSLEDVNHDLKSILLNMVDLDELPNSPQQLAYLQTHIATHHDKTIFLFLQCIKNRYTSLSRYIHHLRSVVHVEPTKSTRIILKQREVDYVQFLIDRIFQTLSSMFTDTDRQHIVEIQTNVGTWKKVFEDPTPYLKRRIDDMYSYLVNGRINEYNSLSKSVESDVSNYPSVEVQEYFTTKQKESFDDIRTHFEVWKTNVWHWIHEALSVRATSPKRLTLYFTQTIIKPITKILDEIDVTEDMKRNALDEFSQKFKTTFT